MAKLIPAKIIAEAQEHEAWDELPQRLEVRLPETGELLLSNRSH